jgi:hypothetical protein
MHKLVIRLNGIDAAFLPVFRGRARLPRVCTSVSVFVFRDQRRVHHTLLDIGPGVSEAIQEDGLFPEAFPIDWLLISHSHMDHFLGLDSLCGDLRGWALARSAAPPRLRLYCLPQTFDETVGAVFPYLRAMLDYTPATAGVPFPLWKDETAELNVTLLEVSHFRQSAVAVFTFAVPGVSPARVVCLFDFGAFYPPDSPPAVAGGRPDNPLFLRPDLLIAEATNWTEEARTVGSTGTHLAFEGLAAYLPEWAPLQTRVVHYAGYGDLQGGGGPAAFQRRVNDGLHLHPREGPVAPWEFTAAVQEYLHQRGFARPFSVCAGRQGETLVVFPRVEDIPGLV